MCDLLRLALLKRCWTADAGLRLDGGIRRVEAVVTNGGCGLFQIVKLVPLMCKMM